MDFDEFVGWFKVTCASIERYRKGIATKPLQKKERRRSPQRGVAADEEAVKGDDSVKEEVVVEVDADAEELLMERFVARARKKFAQLDADKSGVLEGVELMGAMGSKLMARLDTNGDGCMDFDEFVGWFNVTCASIERYRKGIATKPLQKKERRRSPQRVVAADEEAVKG